MAGVHNVISFMGITKCMSVSLSGRQEWRIWEAGSISDSLIRLQERIFYGHSYICCSSVQNGQLALSGNRWDGGLQFVGFDSIVNKDLVSPTPYCMQLSA